MFRRLNTAEDLGAPAVVAGVDILTLEAFPEYNKWAAYIMTGVGYAAALTGFGGGFLKQIGVASLPLTARNVYDYVKAQGGASRRATSASRFALRPVSQRSAPAVSRMYQTEFEEAGSHAF